MGLRCSQPGPQYVLHNQGRQLVNGIAASPRYWDNEMDPGAKRARVLFFQHFSRRNRSGVRIGHFHSSLKSRRLEVSPVPRDEEINLGATAPRFVRLRAYNFREGTRTGIGEGRRFETRLGTFGDSKTTPMPISGIRFPIDTATSINLRK